jgi:cytoskeletal protein RodZ
MSNSNPSCPSRQVLAAYLRNKLTPAQSEVVKEHVTACAACAGTVRHFLDFAKKQQHTDVPLRRLDGDNSKWIYAGVGFVAAAALGVGLWLFQQGRAPQTEEPAPMPVLVDIPTEPTATPSATPTETPTAASPDPIAPPTPSPTSPPEAVPAASPTAAPDVPAAAPTPSSTVAPQPVNTPTDTAAPPAVPTPPTAPAPPAAPKPAPSKPVDIPMVIPPSAPLPAATPTATATPTAAPTP